MVGKGSWVEGDIGPAFFPVHVDMDVPVGVDVDGVVFPTRSSDGEDALEESMVVPFEADPTLLVEDGVEV